VEDARQMVEYILSLGKEQSVKPLPLSGSVTPGKEEDGVYVLTATYYDKGANGLPSIPVTTTTVLRSGNLKPDEASQLQVARILRFNGAVALENVKHNSWAAYKNIDLTGVKKATLSGYMRADMTVGGEVEIHLDKPDGKLLGKVSITAPERSTPSVKLDPVDGVHDLYFVFTNAQAGDKNLFYFGGAKLENK
jgi:cytochrome c